MSEEAVSSKVSDQSSEIQALTMALQNTKEELIQWCLIPDQDGDTSIHLAVIREDNALCLYLCRLLASSGYSVDIRNKLMQTPLHLSCILGNLKLSANLLQLDAARVDCGDRHGNTCLHLAVKHDDEMCELLRIIIEHLRERTDRQEIVNTKNIHGYSALHVASSINKPEAIKLLVAHGAEINQPDTKSGKSPLYIAVQEKNGEAAQVLLELGADANQLTYFRDSPSQLASSQNRRPLLRLISKYDPASQPSARGVGCRRDSRRGSGMVSQDSSDFDTNQQNGQAPLEMSATNGTPHVDNSGNARRVIVTNSPSRSERSGVTGSPTVKTEKILPTSGTVSAYPTPTTHTSQRKTELETKVSQTIPLTDHQTMEGIVRARKQFLLNAGSLSHVLSPGVMAASVYSQQGIIGKPWRPILPLMTEQLQGFGIPRSAYGLREDFASNDRRRDEALSQAQCMTTQAVRHAAERSCVNDESSSGNAVSSRKIRGITTTIEPLDLSQSREEEATDITTSENNANMLLEGKMNVDCESNKAAKGSSELETEEEIQRKVKQEVVENDPATIQQSETAPRAEEVATNEQAIPMSHANLHLVKYGGEQNMREAFVPFPNPWLNFPAAILNPYAYAGYIPTALAGVRAHPAFAAIDPAALSQRGDLAAGLSQWVNFSVAAGRLRQTPVTPQNENQSDRKRKYNEAIQDQVPSGSEEHMTGGEHVVPDSAPSPKRFRTHESSDGLHRSVSDDSGKARLKDQDPKNKLRRRNSAPSSGIVTQVLQQEEQKRVAPVDLLSYRGCLPPHCLHLLRASGNLVTGRENALADVEKTYHFHPFEKSAIFNDRQTVRSGPSVLQRSTSGQRHTASANGAGDDDLAASARRVPSPKILKKTNSDNYRESFRPPNQSSILADRHGKIVHTTSVPIYPRTYFPAHQIYNERGTLYQKNSTAMGFPEHTRQRSIDRARRTSETDSDDDDHIEKLQISDASSDEDEEIEISCRKDKVPVRSIPRNTQNAKNMGAVDFGKGPWTDLDYGKLPAFGGSIAVPRDHLDHIISAYSSTPTKMACSVSTNVPQALNGLPRVYCTSRIFKSEPIVEENDKALAQELLPHHCITESRKEFQFGDLHLPTTQTPTDNTRHKCKGCSCASDRSTQDELRTKLIGDIFQHSYSIASTNGYHRTAPRCKPRLVFTSEVKLPSEVDYRKKLSAKLEARSEIARPKSTSDVGAVRHTEIVHTSAAEYSHKVFSFARSAKAPLDSANNVSVVRSVITGRKDSEKLSSSERDRPSILSGSVVLASRTKQGSSSSSSSARLSSLDAKLEELRQKATEREEQRSEASCQRSEKPNKMQAVPESMKSEVISAIERASHSPNLHRNTVLDTRHRPSTSPFYESDSGRFTGKRNVAVIKPNQAIAGASSNERKMPGYVCPPKKRHMRRYSPEFYSTSKSDVPMQDREVRSASPLPRAPFVSTNVLINNEDHSLNVRWCSPERSPNRRKMHGSNSRTILTYRLPLGQRARGSNSHTLTLEQRNYRKAPRCVPSPHSDAVIVVESRLSDNPVDQREERLEIEDLEISDDET